MRIRKKPWADKELFENPRIIKEPEKHKGEWNKLFENDNPIFLEIGCGKGRFICKTAEKYPEVNFIAMEKQPSVAAVAARRIGEAPENIILIHGLAENLENFFDNGEVRRIYINFCDPWPKSKQGKRRLTSRSFLESYKKLFGEKGEIFFKTDNEALFDFSLEEFEFSGFALSETTRDLHASEFNDSIMTEYEEKFLNEGKPIFSCKASYVKK